MKYAVKRPNGEYTGTIYDTLTPAITAHHNKYNEELVEVEGLNNNPETVDGPGNRTQTINHYSPILPDMVQRVANERWKRQTSGVEINGIQFHTDRESVSVLTDAGLWAIQDSNYTVRWKAQNGWVDLSASLIVSAATAVNGYVQACYARESEIVDAVINNNANIELEINSGWPNPIIS